MKSPRNKGHEMGAEIITRVLNCGLMRPRGARLFIPDLATVPCLCLLMEAGGRLVLVDSGFGTRDVREPGRLGNANLVLNARRDPGETAVRRVERLGFRPEEVTDIICTHLDRDHAGGLSDFPDARVHVLKAEYEAASGPDTFAERERYRKRHFAHGPVWVTYETVSPETWFGMECVRALEGLPPEILLVPLPGHTRGHCGVAVETGEGWLLHCGDAYYVKDEIEKGRPVPPGVRSFRRVADCDHSKAMLQVERLARTLAENYSDIRTIASHDLLEYLKL